MMRASGLAMLMLLLAAPMMQAGELVVRVGGEAGVRDGLAENRALKVETPGAVDGQEVRFPKLLPDTPYDISITLRGGKMLAGVDMGWHEETTDAPGPAEKTEPLTAADRKEIEAIVKDVPSFYDRADFLKLSGDGERAVGLVQLVRDRDFHAATKGEVIWRVELYYFAFQAGGWEKVQQANKVLRRARFRNMEEYEDEVGSITWSEALGGVRVGADETKQLEVTP